MRAPRVRRAARGPAPHGRGGGLKLTPVFSAHLAGTVVGSLRLWVTTTGVRRLDFDSGPALAGPGEVLSSDPAPPHLAAALDELRGYLGGHLRRFGVPLDLSGLTPFQERIYARLRQIPYGETVSYGRIADEVGASRASASRAVGRAVGANPIPILIPCHRVVASDGRLTGFSGGLPRKAVLLAIEGIEVDGARATSRVHPEVLSLPF